jgi:CRISPR system Cascade subunit CasD
VPTLLLRLSGPMQSWGTRSRFTERDTELEPSKSGVIGLICSALGRPRAEPVDDLARLRFGVRVDHEGVLACDYHTAGAKTGIMRADGSLSKDAVVSNRYYLAEADFLVGFEGEDRSLLERLDRALRSPQWQLFLGRKSFVPGVPVPLPDTGVRDAGLEVALQSESWPLKPLVFARNDGKRPRIRCVIERPPGATAEVRMDQPIGAAFQRRSFGRRWVETLYLPGEE